jgi:hypothetical protein
VNLTIQVMTKLDNAPNLSTPQWGFLGAGKGVFRDICFFIYQ